MSWFKIEFDAYQNAYKNLGGSFITNPLVIKIMEDIFQIETHYLAYREENQILLSVAVWETWLAGSKQYLIEKKKRYLFDFGNAEFILPMSKEFRGVLPFKCNLISKVHQNQITNIEENSFKWCIAKPHSKFSKDKYSSYVKSKLRKFLREGGTWKSIIELSNTEIVNIYKTLFKKRHGKLPLGIENFETVLSHLRDCLFGYVLFFDDKPISIQIIYRNISKRKMSFEFVNGAFDPDYKRYAPGSLLILKNTTEAEKLAKEADLECYYTFAKYDAEYKAKWCEIISIFQTT